MSRIRDIISRITSRGSLNVKNPGLGVPEKTQKEIAELVEEEVVLENRLEDSKDLDKKRQLANDLDKKRWEAETFIIQKSTRTSFPQFVRLHNKLRMKYRWYYNWHLLPYAGKVHWAALFTSLGLLIGFVATMGYIASQIDITWAAVRQPKLVVQEINPEKHPEKFFLKNAKSNKYEDAAQVVSDDDNGTRIRTKSGTEAGYQEFLISANETKLFDGGTLVAEGSVKVQEKIEGKWQDVGEKTEETPSPTPTPATEPSTAPSISPSPTKTTSPNPKLSPTATPEAFIHQLIDHARAADSSPSPLLEPTLSPTPSSSPSPSETAAPNVSEKPFHHNELRHLANNRLQIGALTTLEAERELDVDFNIETVGEGKNQKVKSKQTFVLPAIDRDQRIVWEIKLIGYDIQADSNSQFSISNSQSNPKDAIFKREYGSTIIDISDFKGKVRWQEIAASDTVKIFFNEGGTTEAISIDPILTVTTPASQISVDDGTRKWVFDSTGSVQTPNLFYHTSVGAGADNLASTYSAMQAIGPLFETSGALTSTAQTLVENTPTRVKVRVQGTYGTSPTSIDNYYTIYPTGEAFLAYNATTVGATNAEVVQHYLSASPSIGNHDDTNHAFVESDTNNNNYPGMSVVPYTSAEFGGAAGWTWQISAGSDYTRLYKSVAAATYSGNMVIDFSNYRATTGTRDAEKNDYRNPATLANVDKGIDTGYLQGEGAYTITADASGDAKFDFVKGAYTRYKPAFKVSSATRAEDNYLVRVSGVKKTKGVDYNLSKSDTVANTLYIQWLSDVSADLNDFEIAGVTTGSMQVNSGSYVGNGVDNRDIGGIGFQPDLVIIKSSDSYTIATFRTSSMVGDKSAWLVGSATFINGIQSLGTDGFQLGTLTNVNENGKTFHWQAFKANGGGDFAVGKFTGDGTDNRDIGGLGFAPDMVAIKSDVAGGGYWRTGDNTGDESVDFAAGVAAADMIQSFGADGFQVGTGKNANGVDQYWFAFKSVAGFMARGTYNGNGNDNRNITGVGFQPGLVLVKSVKTSSGERARFHPVSLAGDSTLDFSTNIAGANVIQGLQTDGFQLGTDLSVNAATVKFIWFAWQMNQTGGNNVWTDGTADGKWSTDGNWSAGHTPTSAEIAQFGVTKTDNCNIDAAANVAGLIVSTGYSGTITANAAVTVTGDFSLEQGTYNANGQALNIGGSFSRVGGTFTHGNNTTTFNATSTGKTILSGGQSFYNLTFNNAGGGWTFQDNSSIANDFNLTNGTLHMGATTMTVTGNFTVASAAGFGRDTSTVVLNGTSKNMSFNGKYSNNVQISGTISNITEADIVGTLTVDSGKTLSITTGVVIMIGGTTTINGTIDGTGRLELRSQSGANLSTSGILSAPVRFYPEIANVTVPARTYGGDVVFYNNQVGNYSFILGTASGQSINFNSNFIPYANAGGNATVDATTYNPDVNINGNISMTKVTGVPSISMGSGTWSVAGNINFTSGTVNAGSSTAVLGGTAQSITSAGQAFNNLTIAASGDTVTPADALTVNGNLTVDDGYRMKVGSYVGDGTDDRPITGLGFQPDYVVVKTAWNYSVMRHSSQVGDASTLFSGWESKTNRIQSILTDGFQIGNNVDVNNAGATYYYWAWKDPSNSHVKLGTYTGNGADDRSITGVGFRPDNVIVWDEYEVAVFRTAGMIGDISETMGAYPEARGANEIQALEPDGFQVGSSVYANLNGSNFRYVAFRNVAGFINQGWYFGNGADNRSISGVGSQPDLVWVKKVDAVAMVGRPSTLVDDNSYVIWEGPPGANSIQALEANGFQVGTNDSVNTNGSNYVYSAWKQTAASTLNLNNQATDIGGNVSIGGLGTLQTSNAAMSVGGSWANNGTFTAGTSTVTFDSTAAGKTVSGTLNGASAFNKIAFNGVGGSWTINDSMLVDADDTATDFVIGNGTVTYGNDGGETLELHGKMTIAYASGQTGTFQTALVSQTASPITVQMNKDANTTCANCIITVGFSSGAGQGNLKINKNTIVKLIPHNDALSTSDTGIEVEATGYLEILGGRDYEGLHIDSVDETTLTDTTFTWTIDENNGKVVRITNTSSLAFGKIYDITDTTANTLVRADNSSADSTIASTSGSGPTRLVCAAANTLIANNDEGIGRYIHDATAPNTGYLKIVDSFNDYASCASKDGFTVIAEPDAFAIMVNGDAIDISDGVRNTDQYEILDYAKVQAESDTCAASNTDSYEAYIYAKADSESIIKYADICDMGRNAANKYGVSFYTVNGTDANEGATIEKSKVRNGYRGIFLSYTSNNNSTNSKGFTNNSVSGNANIGVMLSYSNNNILSSNNAYSNSSYGIYLTYSSNDTLSSNNAYSNSDNGIYLSTNSRNNTVSLNNTYRNTSYGIYLNSNANNTRGLVLDGTASTGNISINDNFGGSGANSSSDINFTGNAHNLRMYNSTLASTPETSGITTTGAYLISRKHDTSVGATRIWNDYSFPTNSDETLQNEATDQFNYNEGSWPDSFTPHGYNVGYGAGTEDDNLGFGIDTAFGGDGSVYNYYVTCANTGGTTCGVGDGAVWDVYRNGTLLTNKATKNLEYIDTQKDGVVSAPNVKFTIGGGSPTEYTRGATYTFTAWKASGDTGTNKTVTMMQDNDTFTVGNTKTLESVGADGHRTSWTTGAGAGKGYNVTVQSGGTLDSRYTNWDYLKGPLGISIESGGAVSHLDNSKFDNMINSATDAFVTVASSVIGAASKTNTAVEFNNTGAYANCNVNRTGADDSGHWDFDASLGTFDGETFDCKAGVDEDNPGMLAWDDSVPTPPTIGVPEVLSTTSIHWKFADTAFNETGFKVHNAAHAVMKDCPGSDLDSCDEIGLSPNIQYTRHIHAYNGGGDSLPSGDATIYTWANKPDAPTIATISSSTLNVVININGNPPSTEFAIRNDTLGQYVQADGSLGAGEVWQNRVAWGDGGGKNNTGLDTNLNYTYKVKARNGDSTETALSDGGSKYTFANVPDAPTLATVSSSSLNIVVNVAGNPVGTEFAIQNVTDGGWVKADGTLGVGEVWQTAALWGGINNVGLNANTLYNYKVKARNGNNAETGLSGGAAKFSGANDPGWMTATALSSTAIKLDWLSGGAQSKFNIYRDGASGVGLLVHSANDLTYTDNGLNPSSPHTYYVYALNGDDVETTNFSTATATTQAAPGGGGWKPGMPTASPSPSATVTPSEEPTTAEETELPHIPVTLVVDEPATFRWGGLHFDLSWLKLPGIHLPTINLAWLHWPTLPRIALPTIHLPSLPRISIHWPQKMPQFSWDFGDGFQSAKNKVKHTYNQVGQYVVKLKVTRNGRDQEIVKKVTVIPPPPEITDIKAEGADIVFEGKAYPESTVNLTISSDPITVSTTADKLGIFNYLFRQPEQKLTPGDHEVAAVSVAKAADGQEIEGLKSKTYDFFVDYQGQMAIVKKQAETWKYVALASIAILLIIVFYGLFWRRIFNLRHPR